MKIKWDVPLLSLLVANFLIFGIAIWQDWSFALVFFVYWIQTIIILISIDIKIITSKNLKTGFYSYHVNGAYKTPDMSKIKNRIHAAVFLSLVMGLFFAVYLGLFFVFLEENFFVFLANNIFALLLATGIFVINHMISLTFFMKQQKDLEKLMKKFLSRLFIMHFFIVFAGVFFMFLGKGFVLLIFFILVKTVFDFLTHAKEHGNIS